MLSWRGPASSRASFQNRRLLSFKVEDVLCLRPPHPLLEVLLPNRCPGPAVEVFDSIFDLGARDQRRCAAVDDEERLIAVSQIVRRHVVEVALPRKKPNVTYRLHQPLLVIEDRFVLETE